MAKRNGSSRTPRAKKAVLNRHERHIAHEAHVAHLARTSGK